MAWRHGSHARRRPGPPVKAVSIDQAGASCTMRLVATFLSDHEARSHRRGRPTRTGGSCATGGRLSRRGGRGRGGLPAHPTRSCPSVFSEARWIAHFVFMKNHAAQGTFGFKVRRCHADSLLAIPHQLLRKDSSDSLRASRVR